MDHLHLACLGLKINSVVRHCGHMTCYSKQICVSRPERRRGRRRGGGIKKKKIITPSITSLPALVAHVGEGRASLHYSIRRRRTKAHCETANGENGTEGSAWPRLHTMQQQSVTIKIKRQKNLSS